jgi:spore coat protein CotH
MRMSLQFKRYYFLLVLLVLAILGLVSGFGSQRITAYTVPGNAVEEQTVNFTSPVALFDDTVAHTIQILITDSDYQQMITTYKQAGLKEYFHADVIIDGERVSNVGLRLKGNASLRTAVGGGPGGFGGPAGRGNVPQFDPQNPPQFDPQNRPQNNPQGRQPNNPQNQPENGAQPPLPGGGAPVFGDVQSGQTGDATKIPLMIKFDEFVSGQRYQGYALLAIRTYGVQNDAAMLHEPITNDVFRAMGLPATRTAYAGVRLNDDPEKLYSISEVIDETYLSRYFYVADGVLYKAEVGANLNYLGEDPSAYARSFTQQTRQNDADLAPLIAFTRFLSQSDDATFEKELPNHLDVESFAAYLAINSVLVNNDSIIGMSNNYYLYYDDISGRFTLLMWDANESLGKMGGGQAANFDIYNLTQNAMGRRMGGPNLLVTRFMSNASFKAMYEETVKQVYQVAFASGAMAGQVEKYADLVRQANAERDLVGSDNYDRAVNKVLDFITQRGQYLAGLPLIKEIAN